MADEPTSHNDEQSTQPTPADAPTPLEETSGDAGDRTSEQPPPAEPAAEAEAGKASEQPPAAEEPAAVEEPAVEEPAAAESAAGQPVAGRQPVAGESAGDQPVAEESPAAEQPVAGEGVESEPEEEPAPRVKPSVPGAHLEVDIVPEGVDPLAPEQPADPYAIEDDEEAKSEEDGEGIQLSEPISSAAIDLAAGARYKATGKRKTAIARVILRPGSGSYLVNGRALDEHFPRITLQRNIRQPLETVGYQERMDVVARLHGGGISAQAGALRHGISRALLEADPNLRGELKRRGFLTRDSRAKERKKAGLKKARKRPQFSKR
jgi:small subunit ribosomal protein S9